MSNLSLQWSTLCKDWSFINSNSIALISNCSGWRVTESYKDKIVFDYQRNKDGSRSTEVESSLLGVTTLNIDKEMVVFVTEGVSDFLALKILIPSANVVGHTHTQWSKRDISFLSNFKSVIYCSDYDLAGIKATALARNKFPSNKFKVYLPYFSTSKDVADDYMHIIKTPNFKSYVISHYQTSEI